MNKYIGTISGYHSGSLSYLYLIESSGKRWTVWKEQGAIPEIRLK
jgi:hypothetical protein